jgi:membrane protease YdiL (CAAX protease family)
LILPFLKFVVPFLLMLPRDAKRNPRKLVPVAVLILFAQFWELYVMVGPAIGHGEEASHGHLPVVEFAATLGFIGLFTLVFGWFFKRHDAVPLKDPAIRACLEYHT